MRSVDLLMSKFIVFEGIDGSGKSTIAQLVADGLEYPVFTSEPTDSQVGRLAKKVAYEEVSPYLELFLYLADRAQHTVEIKCELSKGRTVICDRYWGSTAAYQAAHGIMDLDYLTDIQNPFVLEADITILFDLDVEEALERISGRDDTSKYERLEFLNKVRDNYVSLAKTHDWHILDAGQSRKDVLSQVKELVCSISENLD